MWLDTYIDLIDRSVEDLGMEAQPNRVRAKFLIDQIVAIRECIDNRKDTPNPRETYLYLKSGETFIIKEPYDKIAGLINPKLGKLETKEDE